MRSKTDKRAIADERTARTYEHSPYIWLRTSRSYAMSLSSRDGCSFATLEAALGAIDLAAASTKGWFIQRTRMPARARKAH